MTAGNGWDDAWYAGAPFSKEAAAAARAGSPVLGPGFGDGAWLALGAPDAVLTVPRGAVTDWNKLRAFCQPKEGALIAGFIGYEAAQPLEPSLALPPSPDGASTVWVGRFPKARRLSGEALTAGPAGTYAAEVMPNAHRRCYEAKVQAIVDAIYDGALFQANLSRRLSAYIQAEEDPTADLFIRLMQQGAARFAAYLPFGQAGGEGAVLSNSPELFLDVKGDMIRAEPIKGTSPRGATPEADAALAEALASSEKDRAENMMIVDLMRNDLAKVCEDASIAVPERHVLRTLPYVHHLVSSVTGQLRPGISAIEALQAAFPCGSITGAPKHRAMQWIAELEGEGRGPYCGTVFCLSGPETAVFSVAIRTAVYTQLSPSAGRLDMRSGGGITALSDAAAEYDETAAKAAPFRAMLGSGL